MHVRDNDRSLGIKRQKLMSFCSSPDCRKTAAKKRALFRVANLGSAAAIKASLSAAACPKCQYALFWSRYYYELREETK